MKFIARKTMLGTSNGEFAIELSDGSLIFCKTNSDKPEDAYRVCNAINDICINIFKTPSKPVRGQRTGRE